MVVDAPIIGLEHPDAQFVGGVAARTAYGPTYELDWELDGHQVTVWGGQSPQWPWELAFVPDAQPVRIRGYHGFFDASEPGNEHYFWHERGMAALRADSSSWRPRP